MFASPSSSSVATHPLPRSRYITTQTLFYQRVAAAAVKGGSEAVSQFLMLLVDANAFTKIFRRSIDVRLLVGCRRENGVGGAAAPVVARCQRKHRIHRQYQLLMPAPHDDNGNADDLLQTRNDSSHKQGMTEVM